MLTCWSSSSQNRSTITALPPICTALMNQAAGPSRPRRPSPTSTHVFDDEEYDEDADALPGYSAPRMPDSPERVRQSQERERLLARTEGRHGDTARSELQSGGADIPGHDRVLKEGRSFLGMDPERGSEGDSRSRRTSGHSEARSLMVSASLAQRRAAWWRSTLITAVFVCAWYVSSHPFCDRRGRSSGAMATTRANYLSSLSAWKNSSSALIS